jgi:DNA-binding NarL/FixJ family response regulator
MLRWANLVWISDLSGELGQRSGVRDALMRPVSIVELFERGPHLRRAKTLVLSEKIVSVHVSNMLRKTATTNRLELTNSRTASTPTPATP